MGDMLRGHRVKDGDLGRRRNIEVCQNIELRNKSVHKNSIVCRYRKRQPRRGKICYHTSMQKSPLTLSAGAIRDLWKYYVPHMFYDADYHKQVLAHEPVFTHTGSWLGTNESWLSEMGVSITAVNDKITNLETSNTVWERSKWWKSRIKRVELHPNVMYEGTGVLFSFSNACEVGIVAFMMSLAMHDGNNKIEVEAWFEFLLQNPDEMKSMYDRYQEEGYTWYTSYRDVLTLYTAPDRLFGALTIPSTHKETTIYM